KDEIVEGTLNELAYGTGGQPIGLDFRIVRDELEILYADIVQRSISTAERVLAGAQVDPAAVDEVILVGGTTRVPLVRKRVTQAFGRPPLGGINPMEVVACGAALHAHSLFAPPGSAAAEVGVLLDVSSHSLGVATAGGYAEVLIPKNTGIPAEKAKIFSTATDNQQAVVLKVCQGESRRFDENQPLGELRLTGLRAAPRGVVKIEVTFLIDADGILQVAARDIETGRAEQSVLRVLGVGAR
ncbi:MAG TPA: Hsp70 family protein, partial [Kofleriaceae bacterium]|nr:Hsp70 family protein [Kofleriaceae bacterium]